MTGRLPSSFIFGVLIVVFAWLNPSAHWTRIALLLVGLITVLDALIPKRHMPMHEEHSEALLTSSAPARKKKVRKAPAKKKTAKRKRRK